MLTEKSTLKQLVKACGVGKEEAGAGGGIAPELTGRADCWFHAMLDTEIRLPLRSAGILRLKPFRLLGALFSLSSPNSYC